MGVFNSLDFQAIKGPEIKGPKDEEGAKVFYWDELLRCGLYLFQAKASGSKGEIKGLRTVNTEYGAFLAEVRAFHHDRDAEVIRLREVEANCSFWSDQLHMWEQGLNNQEVNLNEWEKNLKVREKRLESAKLKMEAVEDDRYKVSVYLGILGYQIFLVSF